jgi:hypothetical protein
MKDSHHPALDKIVNPDLAYKALHAAQTFGEFGVIIKFQQPNKVPRHIKVTGQHSPGHFHGRISCSKIESVIGDRNILSVELREYITQ